MSEPEIARRCLSCGASVRGRASFCPQCGNRMTGAAAADENHTAAASAGASDEPRPPVRGSGGGSSPLVEEAARVAATLNDKLPTFSGETAAPGNHKPAPEREREPSQEARGEEEAATRTATSGVHARQSFAGEESVAQSSSVEKTQATQEAEARGGRIGRRAATVGASVGENLRPRVEKLREASTVVLDEAADDPGLRFVIIAIVLFVLFLFILLFSFILG